VLSGRGSCDGLRSPIECGVPESNREASIMRRPWPIRRCYATGGKMYSPYRVSLYAGHAVC
jgi:hypothetical protein